MARTKAAHRVTFKDGFNEGITSAQNLYASQSAVSLCRLDQLRDRVPSQEWQPCTGEVTTKKDAARVLREKKRFDIGFKLETSRLMPCMRSAFEFACHFAGQKDGAVWANQFATELQISRLKLDWPYRRPNFQDFFDWTPSHSILLCILAEDYPGDEDDDCLSDCPEYREFWQPFVAEPMERVLALFSPESEPRHKLQMISYADGFVDGALGWSAELMSVVDARLAV